MSQNDLMRNSGSTAISKDLMQQNTQLQGLGFEIFGEQEFVRYPVIGVNQPTSDHKPEGKFHNRVTGDVGRHQLGTDFVDTGSQRLLVGAQAW